MRTRKHPKELDLFIKFAAKMLHLQKLPKIHFIGSEENKKNAFGHANDGGIYIRITERHPMDVMRTIAHELIHVKQNVSGTLHHHSNTSKEDEANALAGRIMREFNTTYPHIFNSKAIREDMAVNNISSGEVAKYDPILGSMQKRKTPEEILGDRVDSMKKESKSTGANPNPLNNTFKNGNRELQKRSLDNLRDVFDKTKRKVLNQSKRKLRDITRG